MPLTLLAFLILISFTVGKNYSFTETRGTKGTSSSKTQAPLAQERFVPAGQSKLASNLDHTPKPSLVRSGSFSQNQRSYGFSEETFMEMCGLSEAYQRQRLVLPGMWTTLFCLLVCTTCDFLEFPTLARPEQSPAGAAANTAPKQKVRERHENHRVLPAMNGGGKNLMSQPTNNDRIVFIYDQGWYTKSQPSS